MQINLWCLYNWYVWAARLKRRFVWGHTNSQQLIEVAEIQATVRHSQIPGFSDVHNYLYKKIHLQNV